MNKGKNCWWFIIAQGQILLQPQGELIPYGNLDDLPLTESIVKDRVHIGEYQSSPCYLINLKQPQDIGFGEYSELRALLGVVDDRLFDMAGRAFQLVLFYQTHQFCGQCGNKMHAIDWEVAMKCYHCQHRCYPRVSPCMIVSVRKGKKLLLALHRRHQKNNLQVFTTLAGFTEAGETLEHCVEREVFEEVGLKVKNIEYVASQPWPFPHSLMMGYVAEYQSGDINIDPKELVSAAWYDLDDLPNLPNEGTLARRLINCQIDKIC
ncbi:NAD(+) diphosphatase [Psychromonas sp. psych-6C06]|uniref:NAD(+) diphosphatase n=1 Tax=Psychromonas sp. psych-6C06 TaxID=2058089 RepID=UPI000C33BDF8|nr:NAD(+) diphosphatase [Psychromonas sp. psych-6C06]PKF61768.1 NAD(+) diphosphatase [Psychromonas sp. psych-6C06]